MGPRLLPATQVRNIIERMVRTGAISGPKAEAWYTWGNVHVQTVGMLQARIGRSMAAKQLGLCPNSHWTHRAARNRTWTPFRNRCGALLLRSAAPVVTPHPGIAEQLRAAHRPRLSGAVGVFALACWRRSK